MGDLVRAPKPFLVIGLTFLLTWVFIALESYPTWDAAFYYSFTRSAVFDGDLELDNDLQLSYKTASQDFVGRDLARRTTDTGRVDAPFAIGSSVIWAPFLLLIRGGAAIGQWLGLLSEILTGFEWYFVLFVSTLSTLLGLLTFWVGYLIARQESSGSTALAATITMLFVTPLLYYQFREPLYSHTTSAFVSGIVILLWWRSYKGRPTFTTAVVLGGAIGLAALVRWQNIAYMILPLVSSTWWWLEQEPPIRRELLKRWLFYCALVVVSALFVFSIQMAHWRILYGSWITVPQGGSFIDWSAPHLKEVLFSPFRGLLPWMPVVFLAIAGLFLMIREKARLAVPLLLVLAISIYVNSCTQDWFGGGGYGPRRFTSELVILIVGFSGLIQALPSRVRKPAAAMFGVVLFIHQWTLFRYGLEEKIGGQVLSMAPDFRWSETSYNEMLRVLVSHLPDIFKSPRDFFVSYGSPLHEVLGGRWPGTQVWALLIASFFVMGIWLVARYAWRKHFANRPNPRFWGLALPVLLLVILIDIWIVYWA